MDFRLAPKPTELAWLAPRGFGKTKTAAATSGGKKFVIQTPVCGVRMFKDQRSTTLYLSVNDDVRQEFAEFLKAYEEYAAGLPHAAGIELSSCIRNTSVRLMVWDDAQWFDQGGNFLKDPPTSIDACACILEFGGCWISADKWGLKWRVTQVQLCDSSETPAAREPPAKPAAFAFLDD